MANEFTNHNHEFVLNDWQIGSYIRTPDNTVGELLSFDVRIQLTYFEGH